MLETTKPAQVKQDSNGDYFALRHDRWSFGFVPYTVLLEEGGKLLAKLIDKTKNIRNFVEINHRK